MEDRSLFRPLRQTISQKWLGRPVTQRGALVELAEAIRETRSAGKVVRLVFICTHNARRSVLAQVSATVAAAWYDLKPVEVYSGGTEATRVHPNALAALERAGCTVASDGQAGQIRHQIRIGVDEPAIPVFSKRLDHPDHPNRDFIAVMVCSDADANCPFVPGAAHRVSLPFTDPKSADGTPQAERVYDERLQEIAGALFFAFSESQK